MYLSTFDRQGNRITSYVVGMHKDIPSDAVAISDEDQALYATNEYIRVDGNPVKRPTYVPTAEERKNHSLIALDVEYQLQFQELQLAWAAANLDNNADLAAAIQADYAVLKAEYQTKREAIVNG